MVNNVWFSMRQNTKAYGIIIAILLSILCYFHSNPTFGLDYWNPNNGNIRKQLDNKYYTVNIKGK